jgi:hypothetical protein
MEKLLALSFFALISLCLTFSSIAQNAPSVPDTLSGWSQSWEVGLTGSQASYSNWSQGGVNNIAATGSSDFIAKYRMNRFSYSFQLVTRFGQTRIQDEGVRKTDDRLAVRNRILYDLSEDDSDFKLFANINFRTQFAEGFEFGAEADGSDRLISNFFAPAYFTQNLGLAYVPTDNFSFEGGFGLQQTIVSDSAVRQNNRYGVPEGDNIRNEAGLTLAAAYSMRLGTNLSWSTSLESFTNLNKAVSSTDVYFLNQITGRINRFMNASLRFDIVFDDDFSKEVQVAQILSVGVSFILI